MARHHIGVQILIWSICELLLWRTIPHRPWRTLPYVVLRVLQQSFLFSAFECTDVFMGFIALIWRSPYRSSKCMQRFYDDFHNLHSRIFILAAIDRAFCFIAQHFDRRSHDEGFRLEYLHLYLGMRLA